MIKNELQGKTSKNGKIEFLRFVFCMAVLIFHCEKYVLGEPSLEHGIHFSLFCHGSMGVEFFFLVSGFLMAKSAYKRQALLESQNLATESLSFIKRKIQAIFPMHVIAFVFVFIAYVVSNHLAWTNVIAKGIESIPSLFLIQMSGINLCSPNHVTWYISCMLIAMALLYPFCVKYYELFTRYIAPILAILILGYCVATTGRLTGVAVWTGVCYKSLLRAISEIALGAFGYELSKEIASKVRDIQQRILITIAEIVLFLGSMIYMIGTFPAEWEVLELFAIFGLVVLAFSKVSEGSTLFDCSLCYKLGKLSLPLYLVQLFPIYIVTGFGSKWGDYKQIAAILIGTFVMAFLVLGINSILQHEKGRRA